MDAPPAELLRARRRPSPRREARVRVLRWLAVVVVVLLLPVPWQHRSDSGLGLAWGMDNRLVVEGQRLDPPGQWSWLTVGRPALVGELVWHELVGLVGVDEPAPARDLRVGSAGSRPANVEPVAAAVGMAAALGTPVAALTGEPRAPDGVAADGVAADGAADDGAADDAPAGVTRPTDAVATVDAVIGGHGPPYSWVRSMSMGSSHGLMVGLVTYTAFSGEDLAAGRHVAGTGQLFADGTVGGIEGLAAKAGGALRAGADVLLVPAIQQHQLDGFDAGAMLVLGVDTLADAIQQLRDTRDPARSPPGGWSLQRVPA